MNPVLTRNKKLRVYGGGPAHGVLVSGQTLVRWILII